MGVPIRSLPARYRGLAARWRSPAHEARCGNTLPADRPIADVDLAAGGRGSFEAILQGTKAHGRSPGEALRRLATSELAPPVVGTPASVADQLAGLFQSEASDAFILTPTVIPGTWERRVRSAVPELQRRGVFPAEYRGHTLRENLRD